MSALSNTPWIAAESVFRQVLSMASDEIQRDAEALAVLPFKDRAMAYLSALDSAQAGVLLGLPSTTIEPITFGSVQLLYAYALGDAELPYRMPAKIKHFPDLKSARAAAAAEAHLQEFEAWISAYCEAHGIDRSSLK